MGLGISSYFLPSPSGSAVEEKEAQDSVHPSPDPGPSFSSIEKGLLLFSSGKRLNIFYWDDTPNTTGHFSQGYVEFSFEGGQNLVHGSFPDARCLQAIAYDSPISNFDELIERTLQSGNIKDLGEIGTVPRSYFEEKKVAGEAALRQANIIFDWPRHWIIPGKYSPASSVPDDPPCPCFPFVLRSSYPLFLQNPKLRNLVLELEIDHSSLSSKQIEFLGGYRCVYVNLLYHLPPKQFCVDHKAIMFHKHDYC